MKALLKSLTIGNKKNLVILSGGGFISQVFPFLLSPVLTRLFTPEQFSVLELVLRISALFAVISTLRFDIAIPLAKEERKAASLFLLSSISAVIVSLLTFVLFIVFQGPITSYLNNPEFNPWLSYIPLLVLMTGISQGGNNMLLRSTKYKLISALKISDSVITSLGKVIYAVAISASVFGLIIPNFIGVFILACIPLFALRKIWNFREMQLNLADLKETVREYSVFPKVNLPNAIVDVLQISLVVILISHFFGSAALGLYALKVRILKTPSIIIGSSAGQIFYQTGSKMHAEGLSIKSLYIKYYRYFALIGLLIFLPIMLFGPALFAIVFGKEWEFAGKLAQYTSPWMFFSFTASALSYLPVILKKQSIVLVFSSINFGLVITSLISGYYIFDSFLQTIILLAFIETLYFIFVNIWYYKIATEIETASS